MTDYSEVRWRDYVHEPPPNGAHIILRMADGRKSISYALGVVGVESRRLDILAKEDEQATNPMQWMPIPN